MCVGPVPPISDPVEIDPRSGDLRVRGQLDFEGPNKTIEFTVVAYNPGSPELNDTAIVTVIVLDENDEAPVFVSSNYNISFDEGNYSTEFQVGLQVGGALVGVEVRGICGGEVHMRIKLSLYSNTCNHTLYVYHFPYNLAPFLSWMYMLAVMDQIGFICSLD